MKLVIIFIINWLYLFQIINCKKFFTLIEDEIFGYDLDKSVTDYREYFSLENMELEQVDDEIIKMGGYVECIKSFDKNVPFQVVVQTQTLEQSVWKDQPMKLSLADGCKEFLNAERFWYNVTKLWTNDVCPPQKGFKLPIESQNCKALVDMPDNVANGPWRGYIMITQASPLKKLQFGFGIGAQFIPQ